MRKSIIATVATAALILTGCSGRPSAAPASPPVTTPPAPAASTPTPAPAPTPAPEPPKPVMKHAPEPTRGIMVSGWYAGSPDLLNPLLTWAKGAGINTLVLDLKAEDGKLTWNSNIPLAKEIGANTPKVKDLGATVKQMHDMGFWVAGRIVTFNDSSLYKGRPSWGIPGFSGGAYSFMDPKNQNVWQYNLDIAKEAVSGGVDEIQFDYVRYPDKLVSGYNKETGADYRTGNIDAFLQKAVDELHPLGVPVSADVFGLTTSVAQGDDMQIGQDYQKIAAIVDYVNAMAYPSHYADGTYGLDKPDRHPYETVKASMQKALDRSQGIPIEKHRPWIQDFTYPAPGYIHYGTAEVAAQVKALKELGIDSFTLWDPSCKYTRGLDYAQLMP
ncbi:MAG: putative glycoside hydrolase [Mycobacterium leprae]